VKLVLDLRILEPTTHGMARYGLKLLEALLEITGEELGVGVLVPSAQYAAHLPADPRVVAIACGWGPYSVASQLMMGGVIEAMRPDLYHCPFYAPPLSYNGPLAVTVHDLIPLSVPAEAGLKHRLFYRMLLPRVLRRAAIVFTVSDHSRNQLVELMGVDPGKIVVTPNGVGPPFEPVEGAIARRRLGALGLPERFVLGVGNPKPHKNMKALVEAWEELARLVEEPPGLVLVGVEPGDVGEPRPGMVCVRAMNDEELAAAYSLADLVCIPSLEEGFGLPALEAMACGAVVVAAARGALPEVVGDGGMLVEPLPQVLAEAMARVLSDTALAGELARRARERAARFSWQATARATWASYQRVAGL